MKHTLIALLAFTALPAWADNTIMCMDTGNSEEMCTCAAETMAKDVSAQDLAHYDAIGAVFAEQRAEGLGWVEAWDKAVITVAGDAGVTPGELQHAMNPVGKAHREAMKGCE